MDFDEKSADIIFETGKPTLFLIYSSSKNNISK
jgi:hypothetical protein